MIRIHYTVVRLGKSTQHVEHWGKRYPIAFRCGGTFRMKDSKNFKGQYFRLPWWYWKWHCMQRTHCVWSCCAGGYQVSNSNTLIHSTVANFRWDNRENRWAILRLWQTGHDCFGQIGLLQQQDHLTPPRICCLNLIRQWRRTVWALLGRILFLRLHGLLFVPFWQFLQSNCLSIFIH